MLKKTVDERFTSAVDESVRRIVESAVASGVDVFVTSKNVLNTPEFRAAVQELMEDKLQATLSAESLKALIAPAVDIEFTRAVSNAVHRTVTHTLDEARKALAHQRYIISTGNKVEPIRNVSARAWRMLYLILAGRTVYAAADEVNVSRNDAIATVKSAISAAVNFVSATSIDPRTSVELSDASHSISDLREDPRVRELWVNTLRRLRELGVVVTPASEGD